MMPNRWLMNELAHDFRKFRSFIKDGVVCVTDCPMTADEREKVRDIAIGVREVDTHVVVPDERMKLLEARLHDLLELYPEAQLTRQADGIVLKYRGHCYDMDVAYDIIDCKEKWNDVLLWPLGSLFTTTVPKNCVGELDMFLLNDM